MALILVPAHKRESEPFWLSAILAPERVGRWLMDFGFGSLVDKMEERLGRRAMSVLLWMAAVALFITCARVIVVEGVVPVMQFVRGVGGNSVEGVVQKLALEGAIAVVAATLFAVVARQILTRWLRRQVELAGVYIAKADKHSERADTLINRMEALAFDLEEEIMRYEAETGRSFGRGRLADHIEEIRGDTGHPTPEQDA